MYSPDKTELDHLLVQTCVDYQAGNKAALDHVFDLLMPFCLRVCSKTCGCYVSEYDEEASIARMAIIESMEKYDPGRGSFIFYLGQVIHHRLLDFKRKEKKHSLIPFSSLIHSGTALTETIDNHFFEEVLDDLTRKQEICRLEELLREFNIGFSDLVKGSPRQLRSKHHANQIAAIIVQQPELSSALLEKKMLPMKELEAQWQVNRKLADRYRKYIVAAVLIQLNDLPYLKSYLLPLHGGDENVF